MQGRNVIFVNGEMDPWSELSITEAANGIDVINVSGSYNILISLFLHIMTFLPTIVSPNLA